MVHNPSDTDGVVQRQQTVMAVVVDINDPMQSGRVKVRILGEQDDQAKIPDESLQWTQVSAAGTAQLRTVGSSPPHQYRVGSTVMMNNVGQQGYVVTGAMTNNEQSDGTKDMHPNATTTSPTPWSSPMGAKNHPYSKWIRGKFLHEVENQTPIAYGFLSNQENAAVEKRDGVETAVEKTPVEKYGQRPNSRKGKEPNKFGEDMFDFQKNATEFMKKTGDPEVIPNAINMIEQLKKTAEQGGNPKQPDSLGGLGNILGALAGVASMLSNMSKDNKKKEVQKQYMLDTFKRLFGKEPIDQFGNETPEYKKWEAEFLASMDV